MQLNFLIITASVFLSAFASIQDHPPAQEALLNSYIIKLKRSASLTTIHRFVDQFNKKSTEDIENVITFSYSPKIFNGFSGTFSSTFLKELRAKHGSNIEYIERDQVVNIMAPAQPSVDEVDGVEGQQNNPPSWGLPRVSQRDLNLSAPFKYHNSAGAGTESWVVDTGCDPKHPDFEGRATMVKSFITGEDAVDLNGHGTHVAGTMGGKTFGVAKSTKIKCVKVLNRSGSGTWAGVIAGIDFVAKNGAKNKSVMNMSLGGGKSQAVDDAANAAVAAGVVVVVAAGNSAQDACNYSPAGAKSLLAVGATDRTDKLATFSNFGTCVGILAPGVDITSAWISGKPTNTISGTSMASPHVAGVAALLMGERSFGSPKAVYDELKRLATPNKIQGLKGNTVNKLVFNNPR